MAKVKINDLKRAYNNVIEAENTLSILLQELSVIASECYCQELTADLCSGAEIEFRINDNPQTCISLRDIIFKMKNK